MQDAHDVLRRAVQEANSDILKAGETLSQSLLRELKEDPRYAEFEVSFQGRLIDPKSGQAGKIVETFSYTVYPDRDPDFADRTE